MACQEQERASHTTNHARYVSHSLRALTLCIPKECYIYMMFSSSLVPLSLQANMSGARYTELQGVT